MFVFFYDVFLLYIPKQNTQIPQHVSKQTPQTFSVCCACNDFGQLLPQAGAGGDLTGLAWADGPSVDARPEGDDTLDGHLPPPQHPGLVDCYGTGIVGEEATVLRERELHICIRN